jgi:hypothetical protein
MEITSRILSISMPCKLATSSSMPPTSGRLRYRETPVTRAATQVIQAAQIIQAVQVAYQKQVTPVAQTAQVIQAAQVFQTALVTQIAPATYLEQIAPKIKAQVRQGQPQILDRTPPNQETQVVVHKKRGQVQPQAKLLNLLLRKTILQRLRLLLVQPRRRINLVQSRNSLNQPPLPETNLPPPLRLTSSPPYYLLHILLTSTATISAKVTSIALVSFN